MSILNKFKEKGIHGTIEAGKKRINNRINWKYYNQYKKLPIDEHLLVFESEGDCSDNAYALFRYIRNQKLLGKYKIIWLVDNVENFKNEECVKYLPKWGNLINKDRAKALATCKYYIYDHCNVLEGHNSREGQKYIFLTHGCAFKASTEQNINFISNADEIYVTGEPCRESIAQFSHCKLESISCMGYPRLDYFFEKKSKIQKEFEKKFEFDKYKKIALWMPTFRRSKSVLLDEKYFVSETGLPVIYHIEELIRFNEFLKKINTLCIFKIHHLQADMPAFKKKYSNILIMSDNMILEGGLQLYQFIMLSDFLITDYSSIGYDYMLLDRPIIYTVDDYEAYANSRGFNIQNVIDFFAGHRVKTVHELKNAIIDIVESNHDPYKDEREKTSRIIHKYNDGNASERILKHLGVE